MQQALLKLQELQLPDGSWVEYKWTVVFVTSFIVEQNAQPCLQENHWRLYETIPFSYLLKGPYRNIVLLVETRKTAVIWEISREVH